MRVGIPQGLPKRTALFNPRRAPWAPWVASYDHGLQPSLRDPLYIVEGKIDTAVIVECFEPFSQQLDKRTYVFLIGKNLSGLLDFSRSIAAQ